jgi:hypothetical protein
VSLAPGFILTDEYGDMIGLTLTEIAAVVGAFRAGPAPDIKIKGPWPRLHLRWAECDAGYWLVVSHVHERNGEGDTVIVSPADIAEMRAVLAAQGAA